MQLVKIYRGLPGAGKSLAYAMFKTRLDNPRVVSHFSADTYRIDPQTGDYKFDPATNGLAHAKCYRAFLEELTKAVPESEDRFLVVDNTNIRVSEITPYVQAATAYGLDFEVITVWCEPDVAAKRNVHKVPASVILGMYGNLLREQLPPSWKHMVIFERN